MNILLLLQLLAFTLFAFDTRTHVYISQEIINDLEDGQLSIPPYGEFRVDDEIKNAILNNKAVYRMGNVGPDGLPDIIALQSTLHPGLEDGYIDDETDDLIHGWKSDEWFKFILERATTPKEKALAYGFLSHGAADTFAHTYVNMYCGDIFDLDDGETDVEKRHVYLEKFISDRLPRITDAQGDALGLAYQLVAINDELPIEFIKNTLIMNEKVAQQYALSGTASYLAKMYHFREDVKKLGYKYSLHLTSWTFTQAWVKRIDNAIDEYIKMSARMSSEFMKIEDADSYGELQKWIECYATAFTDASTIISGTNSAICSAQEEVVLEDERFKVSLSSFPLLNKLVEVKSGISDDVDELKDNMGYSLIRALNVAALEMIVVKEDNVTHDLLNEQFSKDESDKGLLLIPDMAQRAEKEMMFENGVMNADEYPVLHNAITLSKLSLLNPTQINLLLERAGISEDKYLLHRDDDYNILFNALKTIDGNHQWLVTAPPYPRTLGNSDLLWPEQRHYGYAHSELSGFYLYNDEEIRTQVFNKIFKGPLATELLPLLDTTYPYIECKENPFPYGVEDKRCLEFTADHDNAQDSNTTVQEDEDFAQWFSRIAEEFQESVSSALAQWFSDTLSFLYAYGEELILSIDTILEDDGSTTLEATIELSDDALEF